MRNIIDYYTQRIFPTTVVFKDLINDDDLNKEMTLGDFFLLALNF